MNVTPPIWICLTLIAVLGGCKKGQTGNTALTSQPSTPAQVRVAAAADLQFALADLVRSFEQNHPDIRVVVTYGSSGNFFSQLSNKAPFDLFLSADAAYPQKLVEQGLAQPSALFDYATGKIVLWAPKNSATDVKALGMSALTDPRVRKIAIANPDHAPYGRAAVSALKSANIYDRVKDRLVLGENIAQTAQFASSGSADLGIIALSLALSPRMIEKGNYFEIPSDSYPPIQQAGVILDTAADPHAARLLRDYITSDAGRAVLARFGFATPSR
jgi:molybdate transport system substrate-binding protein